MYGPGQKPIRIIGSMQDITYKKEEEKRIAKAIIDAREQERSFIGEELHDNVNQLLASSMLTLEMANHFQTNPTKVTEFTGRAKEYTLSALNEISKLSHELSPATFDDNTLKDVVETLLAGINLKNQYTIRFHFDERINSLIFQDIQINLYRILQEQVKNILKYAHANTIEIDVVCTANTVRMRTFDNGIGFDTKTIKGGIGLNNMKRRVESFAGKLILTSQPGKGCEIIVEIPYENSDTA
jgi:signal transduction histidine kinase